MEITNTGKQKDCLLITVEGRMDAVTTPEFEQKLGGWIDEGEIRFIVDFAGLDYISSAGLRVLLSFAKQLHADKGQLCFAELGKNVKGVFEISGFYSLFTIYETIEEAMASA